MKLNEALDGRRKVSRGLGSIKVLFSLDLIQYIFVLMWSALCFLPSFGLNAGIGVYAQSMFSFVPALLIIITGFKFLRRDDGFFPRLKNCIKTAFILFLVFFVLDCGISYLYCSVNGIDMLPILKDPQKWLEFLLLCHWPFPAGMNIWLPQSLLYSYLVIYLLKKLHLLRFDIIIASVCLALLIFTGELPAVFGIKIFGLDSLRITWLTYTLPFLLTGRIIRRFYLKLSSIPVFVFLLVSLVFVEGAMVERTLLNNSDLLLWNGFFVCDLFAAVGLSLFICFNYLKYKKSLSSSRTHAPEAVFFLTEAFTALLYCLPAAVFNKISVIVMPVSFIAAYLLMRLTEKKCSKFFPSDHPSRHLYYHR